MMGNGKSDGKPDEAAMKAAQEDLDRRVKEFNAEFIPLLGKYKLGLGAVPFLAPNGQGGFQVLARPQLFDDPGLKKDGTVDNKNTKPEPAKHADLAEG